MALPMFSTFESATWYSVGFCIVGCHKNVVPEILEQFRYKNSKKSGNCHFFYSPLLSADFTDSESAAAITGSSRKVTADIMTSVGPTLFGSGQY